MALGLYMELQATYVSGRVGQERTCMAAAKPACLRGMAWLGSATEGCLCYVKPCYGRLCIASLTRSLACLRAWRTEVVPARMCVRIAWVERLAGACMGSQPQRAASILLLLLLGFQVANRQTAQSRTHCCRHITMPMPMPLRCAAC